ncbi:hypothetical protein [Lelliottia amnigena]|uniref:hypothetical protein n=1 Tax=Lelliottia amnigena TaxID=61646 RepID=UPI0021D9683F|nr:hypothetical protein [Lelliottia amnigena]MCU7783797.1 hypothetical protein [Lelliottia amnigena]
MIGSGTFWKTVSKLMIIGGLFFTKQLQKVMFVNELAHHNAQKRCNRRTEIAQLLINCTIHINFWLTKKRRGITDELGLK